MGNAEAPDRQASVVRATAWSCRWLAVAALAIATLIAATVVWQRARVRSVPDLIATKDVDLSDPIIPNPGYVGPQVCATCHPARVAEVERTKHFRACRLPEPERMPPGFTPGRGNYSARNYGVRYEMTRRGDDFWATAIRSTPAGEKRTEAHIDLVYGGGAADEVYFSWRPDGIVELPLVWLYPFDRWGAEPEVRYDPVDFSKPTTPRCLECHNTWMAHVPGTVNQYRREGCILGITCEKCHGFGREHVEFHRTHPQADGAQAIVHPGHLTRERQLDVCSQCHSNASRRKGPAFSYRPGEPLENYFRIARNDRPEEDHVANQIRYLRDSKCFRKSDNLTCTTCHNPHRPSTASAINAASVSGAGAAHACLKCHQPADCGDQPRLPEAVRGDCVGCHMPAHYKINVWFDTEGDQYLPPIRRYQHRIAIYPEARQEVLWNWYRGQSDPASRQQNDRLARSLVEHWLKEAERYRQEYRFMQAIAAVREALRFDAGPAVRAKLQQAIAAKMKLDDDLSAAYREMQSPHVPQAIEAFKKVLATKPDLAVGHSKLGTLYAMTGQRELAVKELQHAARGDPDDAHAYSMLGWLAYRGGKADDAVDAYVHADDIEPYNAQTNYQLGLALASLGRWAEAMQRFQNVVTIDPKHAGGCQCLSDAFRRQGDFAEAIRYGRRAAALTQWQNADVLVTLAAAYADAGQGAEAVGTAEKALEVAKANDPKLLRLLRGRIDEIRQRVKQAAN
jgi:tetratricopeptide (TPR) repeat protein